MWAHRPNLKRSMRIFEAAALRQSQQSIWKRTDPWSPQTAVQSDPWGFWSAALLPPRRPSPVCVTEFILHVQCFTVWSSMVGNLLEQIEPCGHFKNVWGQIKSLYLSSFSLNCLDGKIYHTIHYFHLYFELHWWVSCVLFLCSFRSVSGGEEIKHIWRDPIMDLLVSIQHGEVIVLPAVMLLHFNASGCTWPLSFKSPDTAGMDMHVFPLSSFLFQVFVGNIKWQEWVISCVVHGSTEVHRGLISTKREPSDWPCKYVTQRLSQQLH